MKKITAVILTAVILVQLLSTAAVAAGDGVPAANSTERETSQALAEPYGHTDPSCEASKGMPSFEELFPVRDHLYETALAEEPETPAEAEWTPEGETEISGTVSEITASSVAVNSTNFPDAVFRSYVSNNFDKDRNGSLSTQEITAVTEINVEGQGIKNLKGMEHFSELRRLQCSSNPLQKLDLTKNSKLVWLSCGECQLTSLDVTQNTELKELYALCNSLTSIDLTKNTKLAHFDLNDNLLTFIDVSKNKELIEFYSPNNLLTSIDVSNNPNLGSIYVPNNQLTSIDVSNNPLLEGLDVHQNQLTSLDLSKNPALWVLYCEENQLKTLDISKNTSLVHFSFGFNEISSIDVSKHTALEDIWCSFSNLTSIDVSNCPDLVYLDVRHNSLSSLDVRNNIKIEGLYCTGNQLKGLDVTKNTALVRLECEDNQISSLDLRNSTKLWALFCSNNRLTKLDLAKNTELAQLWCNGNQLPSINVSMMPSLLVLHCEENCIAQLDVSTNTALEYLYCAENQLSSLDVSRNLKLISLLCGCNAISALDVSRCVLLEDLFCAGNQLTELDVSKNTELSQFDCRYNMLKELDISNNKMLFRFFCDGNEVAVLDIYDCPGLLTAYYGGYLVGIRDDGMTIPIGDGTGYEYLNYWAYENGDNLLSFDKTTEIRELVPEFRSQSLVLSGQIGLTFYLQLPEKAALDYSKSYMEFTVGTSGRQISVAFNKNFMNSSRTYFGFTCPVKSIQMADTISATFHYGNGKTISKEYSVAQYIDFFEKNIDAFNAKTIALIHAIADFGHYEQIYLADVNGWTVGDEYAEMEKHYADSFDYDAILSEVNAKAFVKDLGDSDVEKATYKLHLDSETTVDVYLTPKDGAAIEASAAFNGKTYTAVKQSDGRYLVRIPNISAHLLGDMIMITGTAGTAFTVQVSALSYTRSVLNNAGSNQAAKDGLSALYEYYAAVVAYRK